jgi:hypothetical protein
MLVSELYDLFRSDVSDQDTPYLWTDSEVYRYMNDAYRMFVRMTGGISDASSDLTRIQVVAGVSYAAVSPLILKFRLATLASTGGPVRIVNAEDIGSLMHYDYGQVVIINPNTPGTITHMVIGSDRIDDLPQVQWVQQPIVNDVVQVKVWRLPKDTITETTGTFDFREINEEHHEHLMLWMKYRAYGKQDAETFDKGRSADFKVAFESYCTFAKRELERFNSKVRVVKYGGL